MSQNYEKLRLLLKELFQLEQPDLDSGLHRIMHAKRADAPRLTPSIRIALEDLRLEHVAIVYPGSRRYALNDRVEAVPLETLFRPGDPFGEAPA
jgi:hypothetical protein